MTESLLVEDHAVDEQRLVRVLSLHRPEARNALDTGLLAALVDALDDSVQDERLAGVLLTGGPTVFSAGADVHEHATDAGTRRMELFTLLYESLSLCRLPTAAALEGPAVGGGAELAGACDLRVAGRSGWLRFPGTAYGLPVGAARTIGQVGLSTAKDWVLSGRDVPAEEAHRLGFVQRLVDDGTAAEEALAWLSQVAARDRDTVLLLKRVLNDFAGVRDRVAWENDALRTRVETGELSGLERDQTQTTRPRRW